jgi:hypothetical protein
VCTDFAVVVGCTRGAGVALVVACRVVAVSHDSAGAVGGLVSWGKRIEDEFGCGECGEREKYSTRLVNGHGL